MLTSDVGKYLQNRIRLKKSVEWKIVFFFFSKNWHWINIEKSPIFLHLFSLLNVRQFFKPDVKRKLKIVDCEMKEISDQRPQFFGLVYFLNLIAFAQMVNDYTLYSCIRNVTLSILFLKSSDSIEFYKIVFL